MCDPVVNFFFCEEDGEVTQHQDMASGQDKQHQDRTSNATKTTLGHVNSIFSIVCKYFTDMSVNQTLMEWGIINYDSKVEVFSEPGDSGAIITDICGCIGGSSGKTESSDLSYATPFWWLLQRIRANGFPNAHLNVLA
jgi:hypothetical protein